MVEIIFAEQENGYDKEQVDTYVERLSTAYQIAYDEYDAICEKYNTLIEEYEKLQSRRQYETKSNVTVKTLMNAEVLAQNIIDDANREARRVANNVRKNIEGVKNTMKQMEGEVQKLLELNYLESKEIDFKQDNNKKRGESNGIENIAGIKSGIATGISNFKKNKEDGSIEVKDSNRIEQGIPIGESDKE